jgi:hypothetical protein
MPYLNLDDEFTEHPKVDGLSDGAFRLHVSGMRYCAKNTSDGIIPGARVDRLKPSYKPSQLAELIKGRLWHRGGQGCDTDHCPLGEPGEYVVHDYLEWNKSAEWWDDRRRGEAERKAEWRRKAAAEKQRLAELEVAHQQGLRSV